jgi:site-specific recombinase XerD
MNKLIRYRLVFNRKHQLNRNGQALVQIELLKDSQRTYFSTNVYLRPEDWDGCHVVNHPLATELNKHLFDELIRLQRIEFEFINRGRYPTLRMIRNAVKNHATSSALFSDFVESVNRHASNRGKHTRDSYRTLVRIVDRFQKDTTLDDIDIDWLNRFVSWQKSQNLSQSTIAGRLKCIRCIINEAIARKLIHTDDDPFRHFRIPKVQSRKEFLTTDELKRLEKVKLKGREAYIRDVALFALYTGLRFSDLNSLTSDNIVRDNGKTWLVKIPEKTSGTSGVCVRLPLYSLFGGKALELIEKYGRIERLTHVGNNASANRTLKDVMRKIGIPESRRISFHTCRHSFASLLLAKGVPITTIQKCLGHSKIDQSLNYSHMTTSVVRDDIEKAFVPKKSRGKKTEQQTPAQTA